MARAPHPGQLARLAAAPLRVAAPLVLLACSLQGLDELPVPRCTVDADCAALADTAPAPTACQQYLCRDDGRGGRRCLLGLPDRDGDGSPPIDCAGPAADCDDASASVHPGASEACNGVDDDCDFGIDEGALGRGPTVVASIGGGSREVSFASSEGVAVASYAAPTGEATALALASGAAPRPVRWQRPTSLAAVGPSSEVEGCWSRAGAMDTAGACAFAEHAIGVGDANVVVGLDRGSCESGRVAPRAALVRDLTTSVVDAIADGPLRRSTAYAGLAPAAQASCGAMDTVASAITVAVAPNARPGRLAAVAAWLTGPAAMPCDGMERAVDAVGLYLEESGAGTMTRRWLDVADEGAPRRLGSTRSTARPAVVGTESGLFFVSFTTAEGQFVLHPLRLGAAATPFDESPGSGPRDRTSRGAMLAPPPPRALLQSTLGRSLRADAVSLTVALELPSAADPATIDLAIFAVEDCAEASRTATVILPRIAVDDEGTATVATRGLETELSTAATGVPVGLFVGNALVRPDAPARAGRELLLAAIPEANGLRIRPIETRDLSTTLIDDGPGEALVVPGAGANAPASAHLYRDAAGVIRYAWHAPMAGAVVMGAYSCAAP